MLAESLTVRKERLINKHDFQPYFRNKDTETAISDDIRRTIDSAITMSDDLEFFRTKFENDLLKILTFEPKNQEKVENLLDQWIDLRINDLKSKPEYKLLNDSQFKNSMLDGFKEKVVTELGLRDHFDNFRSFEDFFPIDRSENNYKSDIINKHNLNHIMENALGYDRLMERLQSPKDSAKLAQGNYFEKLLAEYFIDKRKDYKASKDMLDVLNREFSKENFYDQTKRIGQDLDEIKGKASANEMNSEGLSIFDALSNENKDELELYDEDKEKLMKLGDDTNYAIQGETHGVAEELLKYSNKDNKWNDLYPKFDIRRTPKQWVEEKLYEVVNKYFSARERIETIIQNKDDPFSQSYVKAVDRAMTRSELKAFDKQLALKLNKDQMIIRLLQELDQEYAELMQKKAKSKFDDQAKLDSMVQTKKTRNEQALYNKKIKNLDAAYKLIAYRIAKKYRTDVDLFIPDTAFEHYYERQLQRDIQQSPRPINVDDYDPKKVKKGVSEELEVDEVAMAKAKEETRQMYERLDVRYIIEQYETDQKARNEADLASRRFLEQYYSEDMLDPDNESTEE